MEKTYGEVPLSEGEVPPSESELEPLEPGTLIIEDEVLRKGFTSAPNYILEDTKISIAARLTYIWVLPR